MAKPNNKPGKPSDEDSEAKRFGQAEMPKMTLAKALEVPKAIIDGYGGKPTAPHFVAQAIDVSPTSSGWRDVTGGAIAYGLTVGGYNSAAIEVSSIGKRALAPTAEGDDAVALREAALRPRVAKAFFERYNKSKFPPEKIAMNVLQHELRVPTERVSQVYAALMENGKHVGIIHDTKTGLYVALDAPGTIRLPTQETDAAEEEEEPTNGAVPPSIVPSKPSGLAPPVSNRVFIAHGKNKQVVSQLKDLLTFGKLTPVVAEENETTSKPIPEKVLTDMKSCFAGILNVATEEELLDKEGNVHRKLNENVLIEIGAALALYGKNVILLVQKGVHLPSNLQGLYVCHYEGDKLDYEATMKLLKAFNDLSR